MGGLRGRLVALSRVLATQSGGAYQMTISPKGQPDPGYWVFLCLVDRCTWNVVRQRGSTPVPQPCPQHGPLHGVLMPAPPLDPAAAQVSDGLYIYVCRDPDCRRPPLRVRQRVSRTPSCAGARHPRVPGAAVLVVGPRR
ncbi:hypothetical protein ACIQAC_12725 [Streptomyces sp. NPDC088387]|uniref:hypothetical protein n=1 Tax=Streptomyces sp. NPDC088387 TaxID=3365859 RepID=UPI0038104E6C